MQQEKYGFVYIWYDRKHKRYYVGCHWGTEDDGYICSSTWMRDAYKRRPRDFRRRIIKRIYTSKADTFVEEQRYLKMIKPEEKKIRYYNICLDATAYIESLKKDDRKSIGEKISAANKGRRGTWEGKHLSEETKEKIRQARLGTKQSEETKAKRKMNWHHDYDEEFKNKMSVAAKNRSSETKAKISENSKRLHLEGRIGMSGRRHSEETRRKMSEAARLRNIDKYTQKEYVNGFQYQ